MKKVYLFLAEGYEEVEAMTVVDLVRRAGIDLETVAITGTKEVLGVHDICVKADRSFEEINCDDADMLVLPGGKPGFMNLGAYEPLMEQIDYFASKGKYIAAICAAPTIFGKRGLLKGKKACCYLNMEKDLKEAIISYESVCVDANIITSRGVGTTIEFALAIIEALTDKQNAENVAKSIVYNR